MTTQQIETQINRLVRDTMQIVSCTSLMRRRSVQRNLSSVSFTTQQAARRNQVKAIRWTKHAMQNIVDRSVDQRIAEKAIQDPEFTVADPPDREIRMRRYFDEDAQQMMLLRVVIEEVESEIVVVTLYKTSQLKRYLKGLLP